MKLFPQTLKLYIFGPLAVLFVFFLLGIPGSSKFKYEYRKGAPWMYETLVADFDFPLLKPQDQLQAERAAALEDSRPCYQYSSREVERIVGWLRSGEVNESVAETIIPQIYKYYERGVLSGDLSEDVEEICIVRNRAIKRVPVSELRDCQDVIYAINNTVSSLYGKDAADSVTRDLSGKIVANLSYDSKRTALEKERLLDKISTTTGFVNAGATIVEEGESITVEIQQMLDSYKTEYEENYGYDGPRAMLWLSHILLALAFVAILYFTIKCGNPQIFETRNKYLYMLVIVALAALMALIPERSNARLLYLMPFPLIAVYLNAFFKRWVVLSVYVVSMLPLMVFAHGGVELFMIFMIGGIAEMHTIGRFGKGWLQFVSALVAFVAEFIVFVGFRLMEGGGIFANPELILLLFLGAMLTVACYSLVYLFERVFDLVSVSRLNDLADTDNALLRELAEKAPGTYQHCLQVMNMASAVAGAIGADVPLIKVGALYHDIGKIMNPECFIENETDSHYHLNLSVKESARDIIRHVKDGVALSQSHKLPEVVKNFILTHHGTSCTAYFYNRYLNEGGDPGNVSDFFYKGHKPGTKEEVVLMICDSVEAASRTLQEYTPESISALVENIIKSKESAGQFEEADISLREIAIVKNRLKDYIRQAHHTRVDYPKRNA
ncbi:MAG: HDIG domain-containing protein [Bacteroidales bacterium]|nr:HDIG domain-containing protein [Bacteroidales bacterium]